MVFTILKLLLTISSFGYSRETAPAPSGPLSISVNFPYVEIKTESVQDEDCSELKVGAPAKIIRRDFISSLSGVSQSFQISRDSETEFTAEVNLRFKTELLINTETALQEAQSCLTDFQPFLLGPNNEKLKIKISKSMYLKPQEVSLGKVILNSPDQFTYPLNCGLVLHEVLHLFGLVDEYDQNVSTPELLRRTNRLGDQLRAKYDCRVIAKEDSVMKLQNNLIPKLLPTYTFEADFCQCKAVGGVCVESFKNFKFNSNACPKNFKIIHTNPVSDSAKTRPPDGEMGKILDLILKIRSLKGESAYAFSKSDNEILERNFTYPEFIFPLSTSKLIAENPPKINSILKPAHFRFITNPLCLKKNKNYLTCARRAYMTSLAHGGDVHEGTPFCPALPTVCNDDQWLQ